MNDDPLEVEAAVGDRLLRWAAGSMAAGALLASRRDAFWRGFGIQSLAWGAIDGAIAVAARRGVAAKADRPDREEPATWEAERARLSRLLWINAGLDVAYVVAGVALARTKGRTDRFQRGTGWGIAAQGGFLLGFDLLHAVRLREG